MDWRLFVVSSTLSAGKIVDMSLTELCDVELLQFLVPLGVIDVGLPVRL